MHHHHHHVPDPAILAKTRELCATMLALPGVADALKHTQTFLADEKAQSLYQEVMTRGQTLHERQERGFPLADSDVKEFESHRDAMLANDAARNFIESREVLHAAHHSVTDIVGKALELGRVPTDEDLVPEESGCCGGGGGGEGCGCSH